MRRRRQPNGSEIINTPKLAVSRTQYNNNWKLKKRGEAESRAMLEKKR